MSQIIVEDLSFTYDGCFDPVFEHVFFQFDTNWKLGMIGRNGRGKTTFLNLLMGAYEYQGAISTPGIAFDFFPYPADNGRSTMEIVKAQCPDRQEWEILRELSLLDVREEAAFRPFGTLSNGEQTKALLAARISPKSGDFCWCPMIVLSWTGAWIIFSPSTGRMWRYRPGISPPGSKIPSCASSLSGENRSG